MDKLKMQTMDFSENSKKLLEFLKDVFPNCIKESKDKNGNIIEKIDFDILKIELWNNIIDWTDERYRLDRPWKKRSTLKANTPITKTLRPVKQDSVNWDYTWNLYIEWDNFEVLKILQESYLWLIKMIYIDPPYNTGNDFVYNDNFSENIEEYKERTEKNEEWYIMIKNMESNWRFHSDWLSMMYERIKIARDLLKDDWVIFMSIDDNEVDNLRKICDEVFWENNFIAEFPRVTKRWGKSTGTYAKNHDYVLCYSKSNDNLAISWLSHIDEWFKHRDEFFDERWPYKLNQTLDYNTLQYNPTMDYQIDVWWKIYVPGGSIEKQIERHNWKHGKHDWVWRWSKKLFDFWYQNWWIEISKTWRIYTKTYLNATIEKWPDWEYFINKYERTKPLSTLDLTENEFSNDNSNKELTKLMGAAIFDYSKPTSLVKILMQTSISKDDIILDFFSGSATTADAVMQLNAEDWWNRKFIMVQLPELCDEQSEAYKQWYKTICEIWKERIRRAGEKIKEESWSEIDCWFRVYRVDETCMKDVYYHPEKINQNKLINDISNIKEDRTPEDILTQVILNSWLTLDLPIEEKFIGKNKVFYVAWNSLVACFDPDIDIEVIEKIAKDKPIKMVFCDSCFKNDTDRINVENKVKMISPDTKINVI